MAITLTEGRKLKWEAVELPEPGETRRTSVNPTAVVKWDLCGSIAVTSGPGG